MCRRLRGNPVQQQMADLSSERVTPDKPPFSYVGVDCFGLFVVRGPESSQAVRLHIYLFYYASYPH